MARTLPTCSLLIVLSLLLSNAASTGAAEPAWKPIMDGKTIKGWHTNGLGNWAVSQGAFVGTSNKEKLYGHLVSDTKYQDVTVRFYFQCPKGDSGFFIRTRMEEPDKTRGLQIQVGPCGSGTGGIYESYGRGWLQQPTKAQETFCYRKGAWNQMIISANGPRVTVHVNGFKTADLNDPKIKQEAGVLALQMHSGVDNLTIFRDLAVLEKGQITPRQYLYDAVQTVPALPNGTIELTAAASMTIGPKINYMPDRATVGSFTDKDRVEWTANIPQAGTYSVWLEWSIDERQAGSSFVLSVGDQQLAGKVASTKTFNSFQRANIGQLELAAGDQKVVLRPQGEFREQLLHLRQITLAPVK